MENKKIFIRIEVEGKGFNVDLDYVSAEEIKLMLGTYENERLFKAQKTITLKDLEKGGFK